MKIPLILQTLKSTALLVFIGIIFFVSTEFNWLASNPRQIVGIADIALAAYIGSLVSSAFLIVLRGLIRQAVSRSSLPHSAKESYPRFDSFTYLVFLLPTIGASGVQFTPTAGAFMLISFVFAQFLLVQALTDKKDTQDIFASTGWLSFLFLLSGFAAIIYQIVWQKCLFTAFGVNIESITIIVSIFMFGLGMGSIIGGILSKKYPTRLPHLFLGFEVVIGLFGLVSLPVIKMVSNAQFYNSLFMIALATFGLLCIPTIFMGATLPVLVTYLNRHYNNVGRSVGLLYFINTVGSAIACFITADILFSFFGKQTAVFVATFFNLGVGLLVYNYTRKTNTGPEVGSHDGIAANIPFQEEGRWGHFLLILLLSCATGYISLSQEILWFRALSYTTGGSPNAFAYLLGFYLFGIAFGSLAAGKICGRKKDYTFVFIALMLFISSGAFYLSLPIIGRLLTVSKPFGMYAFYLSVAGVSFLMGGIFPVLCHAGIRSGPNVGSSLSWIYFANIIGATAGPLLTGFVLLDSYSLQQNMLFLCLVTLCLSAFVWISSRLSLTFKTFIVLSIALAITGTVVAYHSVYSHLLENLHFKDRNKDYKYLIQNRNGIIAVESGNPDIIYGGGVYDGKFNTDPVHDTNIISRAYMVAALHPDPAEVLDIGLSSGSWARVIANNPAVKKLVIVEINPGYLGIIKKYPEISSVLDDPKVAVHIDDGRRWLNRNTTEKFDIIVMNTTMNWRDGATNLLSDEFLRLCKSHLKTGGVLYYNATFSEDVPFTASHIFKYVTLFSTFVAASDSPFEMTGEMKLRNLLSFVSAYGHTRVKDKVAFKNTLESLAQNSLSDRAAEILAKKGLWHITDDNMATEFKNKNRWFEPSATWAKFFQTF